MVRYSALMKMYKYKRLVYMYIFVYMYIKTPDGWCICMAQ